MNDILRSNVPGKIPSVNQLETTLLGLGYNRADGKLYALKVLNGSKTVVLLGTGISIVDPPAANISMHETLSGIVDGANCIFTTSVPYTPGKISVFVNGLKQHYFEETGENEITLDQAPSNNIYTDSIEAIYTIL
jgi:hypothetical protein